MKEYIERGVQTASSTPAPSAIASPSSDIDNLQDGPVSLMRAPLISRRAPRRKLFLVKRRPEVEDVERRVVSMPEDKHVIRDHPSGSRVVSMPEYIATTLDISLDTIESFSAGDSFEYDVEKRRVKVCPAPTDVPRTPSPPSSPDSILIIDNDVQLSDGFLRKKYLPKITTASRNGWMTWASSPPRPIPALHGPLSLPYARCPSGAEGTIIEEQDNVSRIIWGLGPDESSRQYRADSEHTDDEIHHKASPHSRVPPRVQKKHILQRPSQVRTTANNKKSYKGGTDGGASTAHRHLDHECQIHGQSQGSHLLEPNNERPICGVPFSSSWLAASDIPTVHEPEVQERGFGSSFDDQEFLLRVALVQQSLQNTTLNQAYTEGLKPVFPVSNDPRAVQGYPKIFIEPRLNEMIDAAQRQSETTRQYHQQEFCLKQQIALPTPPSSSSPQWSSNFSPYQDPFVSPEVDMQGTPGLPHHILQAQLPFLNASSQTRKFLYNRQDNNVPPHFFDGSSDCGPMPARNLAAVTRQSSDVSSGLANYLRSLRTLSSSTLAQQHLYSGTASPHLPQLVATTCRSVSTGHAVSAGPPSPESPGFRSRSASYQQPRSVPLARLMQRQLSSVPEEEFSGSSTSGYRFTDSHQRSLSSREYLDDNSAPRRYHQDHPRPPPASHHGQIPATNTNDDHEGQPYVFPHGTSPAKVRLPSVQDQEKYIVPSRSKGTKVADSSQRLKKKTPEKKIRGGV